jgi:hypothetical protein
VKWTPGRLALVTAAVLVTLVAVGVGYLVHQDSGTVSNPPPTQTTPVPSQTPSAGASPSPALPTLVPGNPLTITAKPSPTKKPPKKKKPHKLPEPPPVLEFRLTTFNMLGSSHTSRSGKRPGMASGRVRAGRAAILLARHATDVAGFQELQGDQLVAMQRHTSMDFYPGFSLRRRDSENSIGWRRDKFVAVERRTVTIPYFNGHGRAMPYVRLKNLDTGLEAWFANFHNPADTRQYHHQQRYRTRATAIEVNLANRLMRTGLPVFITGDMNERDSYFCRLTAGAPMVAARGGSHSGGCRPGNPRAVDWIFGSQGVTFSGYAEDRSHLVDITTDHPVVSTSVRIVGEAKNVSVANN